MLRVFWNQESLAGRLLRFAAIFGLAAILVSCTSQEKSATDKPAQKTFDSPASAGAAVYDAAKSGDQNSLLAIFGADSKEVLFSGDATKDKDYLQYFVSAYDQMHRWREINAGGEVLYIGTDNYSFPIPLGQNPAGQWYFDTAAGRDEILARRIGKDELTAITACGAISAAEKQYYSQTRNGDTVKQYSQKLISDEGKQNGLYWPVTAGQAPSPFEDLRDFAKAAGYTNAGDKPQPFDGYYFRFLTKQGTGAKGGAKDYVVNGKMSGGFAVVAFPVDYRNSGIMTFIVSTDGRVYQKDLGEQTDALARAMSEYNPADGWKPAL
jgi:hypothetical protein